MKKETESRYKIENGYLTITVTSYRNPNDKLKYVIKRISRSNLADFIQLYQSLLEEFIFYNYAVGSVMATETGWKLLEDMAKLVPVVAATGDRVPLNLEELEDDYDMLAMLFLTEDVTEDGIATSEGGFKPSLLAKLNHLDEGSMLGKAVVQVRERKADEILAVNKVTEELNLPTNPPVETMTPTS